MAQATKSISYGNWQIVVSNISDLRLIVKLLVEDAVFEYQPGQESNKREFIDLYLCGSRVIRVGGPFNLYQHKARGNWKLGCSLDGKLHTVEGDESDIDTLEGANAFCNSKTDDDNNSINNEE